MKLIIIISYLTRGLASVALLYFQETHIVQEAPAERPSLGTDAWGETSRPGVTSPPPPPQQLQKKDWVNFNTQQQQQQAPPTTVRSLSQGGGLLVDFLSGDIGGGGGSSCSSGGGEGGGGTGTLFAKSLSSSSPSAPTTNQTFSPSLLSFSPVRAPIPVHSSHSTCSINSRRTAEIVYNSPPLISLEGTPPPPLTPLPPQAQAAVNPNQFQGNAYQVGTKVETTKYRPNSF